MSIEARAVSHDAQGERPRAPQEAPQKRNFEPAPRHDQTHLFLRQGPKLTVCVHELHGFYMGTDGGGPLWSHHPDLEQRVKGFHPDNARTAATFANDESARAALLKVLKASDWDHLMYASVRSDVSESADHDNRISEGPIAMCSIEACHAATRRFAPLPHHLLEPHMSKHRR